MSHFTEVSLSLMLSNLNISLFIEMMYHSLQLQQLETSNNNLACTLLLAPIASDIK